MSQKSRILSLALIFLILGMFVQMENADAYELKGYKISNTINYIPHTDFGSTSIAHFNDALAIWNAQAGKTLMTRHLTSRHSSSKYPENDSVSRIYRKSVGLGSYIAQNTTYYSSSTKLVLESDININISYSFANSAQPGSYDVWSVFLHESGHTAGLGHSEYSLAVMYDSLLTNSEKRYLHSDDKNGINAIY